MGWLREWMERDDRGPINDPAWRERHPEYTGPYRKAGTMLDLTVVAWGEGPTSALAAHRHKPDLFERLNDERSLDA